ncbi:LOW QUALITY PROTEIN: uncharacterized protein RCH25_036530 [Pelodytes ibericus]
MMGNRERRGSSDTCNLKCGQKLQQCSCHASCENLQTCCTDYYKLCLQITPYSGTLMGGKDFTIQGLTFNININITCRFNNETATQGYVDELGFAHCISPLLLETGRIPFTLSVNGENTVSPSGTWLAVHHSKAFETEKSELVNSKKWQYYGTPGYNGTLSLKWNSSLLQAQNIRIEVWGYNETGDPYTDSWHASWDYLYTLSSSSPNNGNFNFTPSPAISPFDKWEVGMLRILATDFSEGERNVQSLWSPVHALAWHLEESFRNDSAAWAYEKCMVWKDAEINKLPNFLTETPDCPCTLAQSRADTGRYHTDYGCNIEKNSVCTYHPGAVHCVRSIQARFYVLGAVTNESTLFTYDYPDLIEDYQIKHDPSFLPTFTVAEDPNNPLLEQIHKTCGPDPFRFDALVTNSINIGNATRMSHLSHVNLMESLQPVVSCGWIAPPENGTKSGTTYIEGSVVQFSCNHGRFILIGSRQRTCLSDGTWSGNRAQCLLGETNSCASQCGQKILDCSSEVTCENLGICCLDYRTYCIRISPESGLLMGGRDFTVLNVVLSNSSGVKCRFNYDITTDGYIDDTGHAHCISPLLYETGRIAFEMSIDGGQTYPHSSTWLSVHPGKVSELEKCTLLNDTKWQYYGTPNVDGTLTVTWDPKTFKESLVNIEVWGYQELGKPYTSSWTASWKYLYSLEKQYENNGSFTFLPKPAKPEHAVFEFGSLRINPSQYQDGLMNVHSLWSVDHAMAWHLGEDFRKDSASWAHEKCLDWHKSDQSLPNFLSEIIDDISDTGRFHPDYGCDIGSHSVCTYHPGAVHCVRGIYGSPLYAAGQQCCYDSTGVQVLTSDSIGGSTPDRGHDWGSPPYKKPPRIPGFSHWLYDVVSFYYCCLWSDNCHYYLELRPSSDCRTYKPPKVASAFGDPHLITHDGANYTFKGKGEYVLVTSTYKSLNIQGRTQPAVFPNGTIISVAGFSSLAMQENNTDVIEVRLAGSSQRLEVLLNKEVVNFDRSWIDLKGVFLYSPTNQNVTVMFPSGAGVEVRGRGSFLGVTVLLPDEFMNKTQGLLGVMNQDPTDDFTFRNGTTLPPNASPQELFQLGADWSVTEETSLFTYDSKFLLDTYNTKHDPQFIPTFTVSEDPNDLINGQMNELCESDQFCRFDVLTTRDLGVGNATKLSHFYHRSLVENLKPVVSCGWLKPPTNGKKEGTSYLVNSDIHTYMHTYSLPGDVYLDLENMKGWVQRIVCLIGNANTALATKRRKEILMKIKPKITNMAIAELGPQAKGLLFSRTFVKDLGFYVSTFTALDKDYKPASSGYFPQSRRIEEQVAHIKADVPMTAGKLVHKVVCTRLEVDSAVIRMVWRQDTGLALVKYFSELLVLSGQQRDRSCTQNFYWFPETSDNMVRKSPGIGSHHGVEPLQEPKIHSSPGKKAGSSLLARGLSSVERRVKPNCIGSTPPEVLEPGGMGGQEKLCAK